MIERFIRNRLIILSKSIKNTSLYCKNANNFDSSINNNIDASYFKKYALLKFLVCSTRHFLSRILFCKYYNVQVMNSYQGIDQQQGYMPLLRSHRFTSIDELHHVLFDYQQSQNFHRTNNTLSKTLPLSKDQIKMVKQYTYKDICEVYSTEEIQLSEAKRVLRVKYYHGEMVRALQYHKNMWLLCSKTPFQMRNQKGYYQTLKECQYPEYYQRVIEADVRRTLEEKCQENQQKLSNILRALAKRNPFVGYCQGMNFVINFLVIMSFTEEQIFWITCYLLEEALPANYYTNMLGVAVDLKLIQAFLKLRRPRLFSKLESLSISLSIFCLQWLVCLFTTVLPFYILVILWDLLFLEGTSVLLKAIIVLIDQIQPIIMNCKQTSEFICQIENFKKKAYMEQGRFLQRMRTIYIDKEILSFARDFYVHLMSQDIKNSSKKVNQVLCNPEWPICHQFLQRNKVEQLDSQVWVFKEDGPPKQIENYLQTMLKGTKPFVEDKRDKQKKLITGRTPHICNPQTYELIKGKRANIELSSYNSQTNTFQVPQQSSLNEFSLYFLRSANIMNSTFVFHNTRQ